MQAFRLSKGFEACIGVLIPSVCLCACACVPLPIGGADGAQQPLHPRRQQAPPQHLLGGTSRASRLISPHHHKSAKSPGLRSFVSPPVPSSVSAGADLRRGAQAEARHVPVRRGAQEFGHARRHHLPHRHTPAEQHGEGASRWEGERISGRSSPAGFMPLSCAMLTKLNWSVYALCVQPVSNSTLIMLYRVCGYAGGVLHAAQRVQPRPLRKQSRLPTKVRRDQGTRRCGDSTYTHICI